MSQNFSDHQACYDQDGNIILPQEELYEFVNESVEVHEVEVKQENIEKVEAEPIQKHVDSEPIAKSKYSSIQIPNIQIPSIPISIQFTKDIVANNLRSALIEGKNQYSFSVENTHRSLVSLTKNLWSFLAQPVWIVSPNKKVRQYSRGTLFVLDVFRFGGTFASIFILLFTALNYQSFWQIMSEKIHPLQAAQREQQQQIVMDDALREKLLKTPTLATAGKEEGNLASYLPHVGPPDNRIIIPKLGINVPLVTPSYQSLLSEDWDQVEVDIQDALKMGVVHYPGTARPGQAGNFFVTGHSSYYPWAPGKYKTIFARLHKLEPGDEYYVYYGGDKHRYIVREKKEVKPTNVKVLDQPLEKRMATLMTCTPVGTTLRRLILTADEVDPVTGTVLAVGEREKQERTEFTPQMLPI